MISKVKQILNKLMYSPYIFTSKYHGENELTHYSAYKIALG